MSEHYPFEKMPLPYSCSAFEPVCDADTLYIHNDQIYSSYIDMLNYTLAPYPQYHNWTLEQLITDKINLPVTLANYIKFYAGGVYNHELYFSSLSPKANGSPKGSLSNQIDDQYGSFSNFKSLFTQAAHSILGVGWVWLNSPGDGSVHISTTLSNDAPALNLLTPLFTLDVWEHAYFLNYKTALTRYINSWFDMLDWDRAEKLYDSSLSGRATR